MGKSLASRFLLVVLSAVCSSPAMLVQGKKPPPTALEAKYKHRITTKLKDSLEAAATHLVSRFAFGGGPFGGYELNLARDSDVTWRHSCKEVNTEVDSVETCAIRQLHALSSLCDIEGLVDRNDDSSSVIKRHLKELSSRDVPALGIRLKNIRGNDIWFHDKVPGGETDASPAIQASALMAMVRCADATGQKQYFSEAENWFMGLKTIFPSTVWNTTRNVFSFHKSGIIWESLALVASHVPKQSTFRTGIRAYVEDLEFFLRTVWDESPDAWSFASARALSIRWRSNELNSKKQRKHVSSWAKEHIERFLGEKGSPNPTSDVAQGILAKIGGMGYTCGPLQGLTSLFSMLPNAEVLQMVLKLLEKDVDAYQINKANPGPWKDKDLGDEILTNMTGAFFRDTQQLEMEKRSSIRVDDVAQCIVALTAGLRIVEATQGVEVSTDDAMDDSKAPKATDQIDGEEGAQDGGRSAEL